ncbi:MAG TPA: hypothetical protein VFJ02_10670 [Vicinamibacterales bacterium]|nr:hypothetical protein [Vicinamibacterales bacterium]
MRRIIIIAALLLGVCAVSASAQVAQRPTRPYRGLFGGGPPPDPNRTRHELTFTASILGGYDDYVTPTAIGDEPAPDIQNGFSTNASAALEYFYGRAARSFSADLQAISNAYYSSGVSPTLGADMTLAYSSDVGRRGHFGVTQDLSYEPTLVLGAFAPLAADVESSALPETGTGVQSGFVDQRSWSAITTVTAERRWTPRRTTSANASYSQRTYLDALGFDSTTISADVRQTAGLSRTTSLDASYRYADTDLERATGGTLPLTDHTVEVGLSYSKRLSPTRQIQLSGGGGASYIKTESETDFSPLDYWTPSGHATVRIDVGRSWAVGADYRRAVSVLQGLTLQSFPTNAVSVRVDGTMSRRIEVAASTAYSTGQSGAGETGGDFRAYSGDVQLRFALARCCATSVTYDYYIYRLNDIPDVPSGIPSNYDRNAIRVGFTLWLPLYGSYGQAEGGRTRERAPAGR